ncbi:hypothetical protein GF356_03370 [candidate division GN15 bacterium]|nr:hypothetical protein [candidate division GN15 bacterium]
MIGTGKDRRKRALGPVTGSLVSILFGAVLLMAASTTHAGLTVSYIADNEVRLQWLSPGDDSTLGTAAQYDIRYSTDSITSTNWDDCITVDNEPAPQVCSTLQSYTVQGLNSGTRYYFALKTADEIPNWSVLSNVVSATTTGGEPPVDDVPPSPVAALTIYATSDTSISLRWTVTGDDGVSGQASVYDIRYREDSITTANWASATQVQDEPSPLLPGNAQVFEITGLESSTKYYFAIKIGDEIPNWSAMSTVVNATTAAEPPPPDTEPPTTIADLSVVDSSKNSVTLSWTAPGDDQMNGYASTYEIRYHTSPINTSNWSSSARVNDPPVPAEAETLERFSIGGLNANIRYYFAIRTADEVPNWSDISNSPSATTANAAPTVPTPIGPLTGDTINVGEDVVLSVYNSQDADGDNLTYSFWVASDGNFNQIVAERTNVPGGIGTTEVTFASDLFEAGADYWWHCRASDGLAISAMSATQRFRYRDPCEQPLTTPLPVSPADSNNSTTVVPTLVITNSGQTPDCDMLRYYEVMIFGDALGVERVVVDTVIEQSGSNTEYTVVDSLLTGRFYWWRVRCFNDAVGSGWSSLAVFHTPNNWPTVPVLRDPSSQDTVTTRTPVLTALEGTDPDGTPLKYQFQISKLGNFSTFDSSGFVSPNNGLVSWQTQDNLDNGAMYSWRVRAWDGIDFSPFSEVGTFLVNTGGINNPPESPVPSSPAHRAELTTAIPELVVDNGSDEDNDPLTYQFEVYRVYTNQLISSASGLAETPEQTSWVVADSLQDTVTYKWRARCHDGKEYSKWSDYQEFTLLLPSDDPNEPPTLPIPILPTTGSIVLVPPVQLRVSNAIDPEGDPLVYDFWLYADSAMTQLVEAQLNVPEQISQTQVTLSLNPINGQRYWWRCRARDSAHPSTVPIQPTWFIFSSMATGQEDFIPTLAMPEDGSDVPSERPELYAKNIVAGGNNDFYYFEIARDTMFIEMVVTSPPVPEQDDDDYTRWKVNGDLPAGVQYYWRARANNNPYSAVSSFTITQKIRAYPNPVSFSEFGHVTFNLPDEPVDLLIQTVSGETVLERSGLSGDWTWDGRNGNGQQVAVGTYLWFASVPGQYGKIVVVP